MMTETFSKLNVNYFSDFSQEITGNTYVPEYSGISLILSIERVTPVTFRTQTRERKAAITQTK